MLARLTCLLHRRHIVACQQTFNLETRMAEHEHVCMRCSKEWSFDPEPLPESLVSILDGIERSKQRGIRYTPTASEREHARKDLLN